MEARELVLKSQDDLLRKSYCLLINEVNYKYIDAALNHI